MERVVYAISAGTQNQNQATNAAMITIDNRTLLARMPASVVKYGAAPIEASVLPSAIPDSELKATAPWNV
jgi:hypothetical protein